MYYLFNSKGGFTAYEHEYLTEVAGNFESIDLHEDGMEAVLILVANRRATVVAGHEYLLNMTIDFASDKTEEESVHTFFRILGWRLCAHLLAQKD